MNIPTPTIERTSKESDGSTWYAYSDDTGYRIGASSRTKKGAIQAFNEQWERFA